jgi:diadenosine tetraphosphatase ApaH/serine/threonine PP2A family protein phosphatase
VLIALLADIHANWQALEAVLADLPPVDEVICLGDVVGYGGDPVLCIDRVRQQGWPCLLGNHDLACTDSDSLGWFNEDAAAAIRWTMTQVGPERLDWLARLPARESREGALLVHASPREPLYEYILDGPMAAANLALLGSAICFHGHTHRPGVFSLSREQRVVYEYSQGMTDLLGPALVNPGSVGQPRDRNPDASYGVWDTDAATFDFRRVAYDRAAAQEAIRTAGLPERFAQRLDFGY